MSRPGRCVAASEPTLRYPLIGFNNDISIEDEPLANEQSAVELTYVRACAAVVGSNCSDLFSALSSLLSELIPEDYFVGFPLATSGVKVLALPT